MNEALLNRNRNINRGYRKLEVWREAIELFVFIKKKIDELLNISFKVKAQIEDSAFSVHSNIAEGYARRYLKENIQFNNVALASLAENYSQIFSLLEINIIDIEWFDLYDSKYYSLENKLINYNKSLISKFKNKEEWRDDYILRDIIEKYGLENE